MLKIVKHCQESLPHMVTGSLLGLAVGNGILEVTHSFPFPDPRSDHHRSSGDGGDGDNDDAAGLEGHEFQLEMMRMLREVNVDNNCVGWYQSMYLGIFSTSSLLENQLSYQTDLSPNAIVLLFDPMQTSHGNLVFKCFRLTDECIRLKTAGKNAYIDPSKIFEEVPVKLTNPGLARALLADVATEDIRNPSIAVGASGGEESKMYDVDADTTFDRLDLSTNPYLEKHLEFLCGWVDDLSAEQSKFQYYSRQLSRGSGDKRDWKNRRGRQQESMSAEERAESWLSGDAPRRLESLLISNQIRTYCDQMDKFAGGGLEKLYLVDGLHKGSDADEKKKKAAAT